MPALFRERASFKFTRRFGWQQGERIVREQHLSRRCSFPAPPLRVRANLPTPYLDGEVHFPDVRIEYVEPDGRWDREDIEVVTPHYRGAHGASVARSALLNLRRDEPQDQQRRWAVAQCHRGAVAMNEQDPSWGVRPFDGQADRNWR